MKVFNRLTAMVFALALVLTACTNNEPLTESPQTQESTSVTTALNNMGKNFDANGNYVNRSNAVGNLRFDYGFEFEYPINLSYSNGSVVTVNDTNGLVQVIANSSNALQVNGIAFPFNVTRFNQSANAFETQTISTENEFEDLVESFETGNNEDCICPSTYDPVCVQVTNSTDGTTENITFPNACLAMCHGFSESDFVNCSSIGDCGSCDDNYDPVCVEVELCIGVTGIAEYANACLAECAGFTSADFTDCESDDSCSCPDTYNPVCVEITYASGETEIVTFGNSCLAECAGFTSADFIDCTGENDCTEAAAQAKLVECPWNLSVLNSNVIYNYVFSSDGNVTISNGTTSASGAWEVNENNLGQIIVSMLEESNEFYDEWEITNCTSPEVSASSNVYVNSSIQKDCD